MPLKIIAILDKEALTSKLIKVGGAKVRIADASRGRSKLDPRE
jgi:hypothetical protein